MPLPRPSRPDRADFPAVPATENVVEITIGRVEIRAGAPVAEKTSRKSEKQPVLTTLSEHLRERNGGIGANGSVAERGRR